MSGRYAVTRRPRRTPPARFAPCAIAWIVPRFIGRQTGERHAPSFSEGANHTAPPRRGKARMLTVEQVATELALSEKTIRRRIAARELIAHRIGSRLRVAEDDLRVFLNKLRG